MTIKTKYDMDQEVWVVYCKRVIPTRIVYIKFEYGEHDRHIVYGARPKGFGCVHMFEEQLVSGSFEEASDKQRVFVHLAEWSDKTSHMSDIYCKQGKSYREELVKMGKEIIPVLFECIMVYPLQCMAVLAEITDASPVKEENRGVVFSMVDDWIEYGRKEGYL